MLDRDAEILYTSRTGPMSNAEIASQASELGIDQMMRTVPLLPDASGMEGWRQWHRSAGLTFAPGQMSVQLPDANTRLQAVISGHGIALLDELAQSELDTGQMVRISDIAIVVVASFNLFVIKNRPSQSKKFAMTKFLSVFIPIYLICSIV